MTRSSMRSSNKANFQTLAGKVAIVTGASRGLGLGFAYELARRGAKIVATYTSDSSEARIATLIKDIESLDTPSQCIGVKGDLRDPATPKEIVRQAIEAFGPHIDILVNNAGIEIQRQISDVTLEDFDSITNLNIRAPLLMLQAVKPYLRKPGRIINIASVGARIGFKDLSLYCMSKAALEGLTRCWAVELGADGHTVNSVNPGPCESDLLDNIPKELTDLQKSLTPVENRTGTEDDVAQIVAWLASEESRWVTGQAYSASGGYAMY